MSQSPLPQNTELKEPDLQNLIAIEAQENRYIEFKSEFLPTTSGGKKKFLQAIAAFANARGGDLVMGMDAKDGRATAIKPLQDINPDQVSLQINDLIKAHLRPPFGGVQITPVTVNGGHVIVVRIPKSWAGPHMLIFDDDRRFYIRGDGGKRPMEYEDVRDGFLSSENIAARLRNFRMERCAAIMNDDTPCLLEKPTRFVVHLLPFDFVAQPLRFEARELQTKCAGFHTMNFSDGYLRINFDGVFVNDGSGNGKTNGYAQLFRNGVIEAVDSRWLNSSKDGKFIPNVLVEQRVIESVEKYVQLLISLNIQMPYAIFFSLLNVKDYGMPQEPRTNYGSNPITRDHLYIPELILNTVPDRFDTALFPAFNCIWNACGLPKSRNYDGNGIWKIRMY